MTKEKKDKKEKKGFMSMIWVQKKTKIWGRLRNSYTV